MVLGSPCLSPSAPSSWHLLSAVCPRALPAGACRLPLSLAGSRPPGLQPSGSPLFLPDFSPVFLELFKPQMSPLLSLQNTFTLPCLRPLSLRCITLPSHSNAHDLWAWLVPLPVAQQHLEGLCPQACVPRLSCAGPRSQRHTVPEVQEVLAGQMNVLRGPEPV